MSFRFSHCCTSTSKTSSGLSQPLSRPSTEHTTCSWLTCPSCTFAWCYGLQGPAADPPLGVVLGSQKPHWQAWSHSKTSCLKPSPPYDRTRVMNLMHRLFPTLIRQCSILEMTYWDSTKLRQCLAFPHLKYCQDLLV